MNLETVQPRWRSCVVAAPGPSLFPARDGPIIVVQDAWRMIPWADVLYGCDLKWWRYHDGTEFRGEKWSSHHDEPSNNKQEAHEKWGVRCVRGENGSIFSLDPGLIRYGNNSGFQAINLAILFGCTHITLTGFDMKRSDGKSHFFGEHPREIRASPTYENWVQNFATASEHLPEHIRIVNATPGSALDCFPMMAYQEAMHDRKVHDQDYEGLADQGRGDLEGRLQGAGADLARAG